MMRRPAFLRQADVTRSSLCSPVVRLWCAGLCLALLAAMACTPTHTIRVDMTRARPEVLDTLRAVGAGDVVRLEVIDTVWGNRYAAGINSAAIAAVERNLVFGGGSLQKLSQTFAPVVLNTGARRDDTGRGRAFEADSVCVHLAGMSSAAVQDSVAELNRVTALMGVLRDSINVAADLLASNQYAAIRAFAADVQIRNAIRAAASDTLADRTAQMLADLVANPSSSPPTKERLDGLALGIRSYAQRVDGIVALIPAAALSSDVRLGVATFKAQVQRYRRLRADAVARELRLGARHCITGALPGEDLGLVRDGVDLGPLVNNPALDPAALDLDLRRIIRNTEVLAGAFNTLPGWAVGPSPQLALERSFEGNKEITVSVLRRPRYGRFEARVIETPRAPAAGAKKADGAPADPAGGGAPSLTEARNDTVAVIRFEIYPRYRFHLGAGFVRSPLRTRTYETSADTLNGVPGQTARLTGETPFQFFPVALLSYSLYPAAGQIYDARVRPGWPSLQRMGLAVHAGLSLTDPTDDIMFGVSTEPFPGLRLGAGYHLAYVQIAPRGTGVFVAEEDGPVLDRRWRGEWGATSLTVDAKVFFETVGALLK